MLTALSPDPSINDAGQVAFVGTYADGQGILVGDGTTLTNINPAASHSANLTFSPYVEINNSNQVVAINRDSTNASSYVRTWVTTTTDSYQDDATGSTKSPPTPFDAVLASPAINDSGLTVFPASQSVGIGQPDTVGLYEHATGGAVNTVTPLPTPPLTAPQVLRPQMDQNGDVVFQEGNTPTSPIVLIDASGHVTQIATASGSGDFTALGGSPGLSADDQIVVFSATVGQQGQTDWGITAGTNVVFASVATSGQRVVVPVSVAVPAYNGLEPDQVFDSIDNVNLNASVSVNSTQSTQRAVTIVYDGFTTVGLTSVEGIYSSRLNLFGNGTGSATLPNNPANFSVTVPTQVVQIGDTDIPGLGAVTGFSVFNAVNNYDRGDVAFWVTDGMHQAIVRARPQAIVYLDFNPDVTFKLGAEASQLLGIKLGDGGNTWAGGFSSVFSGLTNRPDLTGTANLNAIELNVVADIQADFKNAHINVKVESSATLPHPTDGEYTDIYIGSAGPDVATGLFGEASSVDLFNQGVLTIGRNVYPITEDAAVVFADHIFLKSDGNFTANNSNIDLSYTQSGKITAAQVATAVADVAAHEIGHTMGLVHLPNPASGRAGLSDACQPQSE